MTSARRWEIAKRELDKAIHVVVIARDKELKAREELLKEMLPDDPIRTTRKEKIVLEGIRANKSNKEIACEMHVSESAVKHHVSNILRKFNSESRRDMMIRVKS